MQPEYGHLYMQNSFPRIGPGADSVRSPDGVGTKMSPMSHKFFAPPAHPGVISRAAILARLVDDEWFRVTVLQGPAGHGKSTTLEQIRVLYAQRGWRTTWLTFDDADNDPRRLDVHLRALISKLATGVNEGVSTETELGDWILSRLTESSSQMVIILDEFQTLSEKGSLELFRRLLARLPMNVKVFLGSRTVPDVGLATLMVNCVATVLRADELRFTRDEVGRFFSGQGDLHITAQEADAIYQQTEGWPAGVQLFKLALADSTMRTTLPTIATHSPREMTEYLTDNVVSLQSTIVQQFLMKTALLKRMSAPLCAAITGVADAQAVLDYLQRSGLFLHSLDAEGCWFKYHGLFANHLAQSLHKAAPEEAHRVHELAAQWLLDHGHAEESLDHSLSCSNYSQAADTLNDWASLLIPNGELVTLERWAEKLPSEQLASRTDLSIKLAYALMFLRRWSKLRPLIERLAQSHPEGHIDSATDSSLCRAMSALVMDDNIPMAIATIERVLASPHESKGFAAFELGAALNVMAFGKLQAGDFDAARKAVILARSHNERGGATFSGGYTTALVGISYMLQGQMNQAVEVCRSSEFAMRARVEGSLSTAALDACHIWSLYETNAFEAAESIMSRQRHGIGDAMVPEFITMAYLSMIRLRDAQGQAPEATEILEQFERIGHDSNWRRLINAADWERVRRALDQGNVERANAIARNIAPFDSGLREGWVPLSEELSGTSLGQIRLALANKNWTQAAHDIARERNLRPGSTYRDIKLHLLEAQLMELRGQSGAAHRSLRKALALGMQGGAIRTVVDEGPVIVGMLGKELQEIQVGSRSTWPYASSSHDSNPADEQAYIGKLLQAAGIQGIHKSPVEMQSGLSEPLSEREKEMVRYLANGLSNKALAARMFVSENTVKFHLKNIYSKLNAGTRLQAINVARAIGVVT